MAPHRIGEAPLEAATKLREALVHAEPEPLRTVVDPCEPLLDPREAMLDGRLERLEATIDRSENRS